MIDDIHIEVNDKQFFQIIGETNRVAIHQLKEAVEDIADELEKQARKRAPVDTGELSKHPTERGKVFAGEATGIAAFGGGTSIRGAGGRFVGSADGVTGDIVARIEVQVASEPEYAIWVHQGTGLYGPRKSLIRPHTAPYMRFTIDGRRFKRKFVRGQKPQPYLFEAYLFVNNSYVPARVALLRNELRALS